MATIKNPYLRPTPADAAPAADRPGAAGHAVPDEFRRLGHALQDAARGFAIAASSLDDVPAPFVNKFQDAVVAIGAFVERYGMMSLANHRKFHRLVRAAVGAYQVRHGDDQAATAGAVSVAAAELWHLRPFHDRRRWARFTSGAVFDTPRWRALARSA